MAQKYKLIERKNLGKDQTENPHKMYVQAVNNGYVCGDRRKRKFFLTVK